MAAGDRILRNEEINYGTDGNMLLVRYKDYEPYDGIKQAFSYTWPVVYYSDATRNVTTTTAFYLSGPASCPGVAISNYTLGSSSPSTPKRYLLMAQKYYDNNFTIYYLSAHNPGDKPEPYTYCRDANGNYISYKYKIWIGWAHMYDSSWTIVKTNPLFNASTLAAVKNTLSNSNPNNLVDSYSFGHLYLRYSLNGISGLTVNGNSSSSHWMQALSGNFVVNGCTQTLVRALYKGDGYNPNGYSSYMNWIIPGDHYDTADQDTYWMYGYLATSRKLYPYSYITLSNYYHTTHLMVTYVGDDADYINSGGQTYNSASGFLNLGSNTQDKNDGLRYIYKFSKQFSIGYMDTVENCLILSGVWNNIVYITCGCRVSCAVSALDNNYTIYFRYRFQVLDNNNNILLTTSKFTHSASVGLYTGYSNVFYDASTIVVAEYPTYYKIKVTQIEWSRDNTSYNNYINCSLTKNITASNGRAEFSLIIYDPPTMLPPY